MSNMRDFLTWARQVQSNNLETADTIRDVVSKQYGGDVETPIPSIENDVRSVTDHTTTEEPDVSVEESVEHLDEASQRFGGDANIPADKQTTDLIQSGKAKILLNVPSALHPSARFVVIQRPLGHKGKLSSNQDKVLMATISNPNRSRIKMFSYHGTHVNHQKAMDFAKHHKLVAMKDAKGRPLYAKESVELDERSAPLPKSTEFSVVYSYAGKDHKFVTKLTNIGGKVDRKKKEVRFDFDSASARTKFRKKNKKVLDSLNEYGGGSVKESVEVDEAKKADYTITAMRGSKTLESMPASKKELNDAIKFMKANFRGAKIIVKDSKGKTKAVHESHTIKKERIELDNKLNRILNKIIDTD